MIILLVLGLLLIPIMKEVKDDGGIFVVIIIILLFIFSIWLGIKLEVIDTSFLRWKEVMKANDSSTGFGAFDPTMLERLERNVWEDWSNCVLGFICHLFLSDVLLFEIERRWWELDNFVDFVSSWTTMLERYQRNLRCSRNYFGNYCNYYCWNTFQYFRYLIQNGGDVMSAFGIIVVIVLIFAFIQLHKM